MKLQQRLVSIDLFRGLIILFMILIHLFNSFFGIYASSYLSYLDFVVFGFLMLIGVSISFHYAEKFRLARFGQICWYFFKRSGKIMLVYWTYAIAMLVIMNRFTWMRLIRTVILIDSNYDLLILLPIAIYILLVPLFLLLLKQLKPGGQIWIVVGGFCSYLISYWLGSIALHSKFSYIKSLVIGDPNWLSFPVLQWIFPVSVGVLVGTYLRSDLPEKQKGKSMIGYGIIFLIIFLVLLTVKSISSESLNITDNKFPPTLYHFAYSLAVTFLFLGGFLMIAEKKQKWFDLFVLLGQNSLFAYVFHWVLIRTFILSGVLSVVTALGASLATLALTLMACKYNNKLREIKSWMKTKHI